MHFSDAITECCFDCIAMTSTNLSGKRGASGQGTNSKDMLVQTGKNAGRCSEKFMRIVFLVFFISGNEEGKAAKPLKILAFRLISEI